ncbi:hypothetical protein AAW12_23190 [Sphingobacterium sp. Ag1]|uniref:hypothetical protein n=1 Tax=Sphingobacterium sp. Ag1 TaxID=1643451 RepID=UPI00062776B9|nr:hypothetical protein [Sphingobacterium sp. Ag1]KKO89065.1 hypothetical protein AAW12_23190 [Sphingobacterium sp. Ag1]
MNQKYSNVLALELALYEIHDAGYDPIQKITEFWEKYDLISIQNTVNLLLKNHTDTNYMNEIYVASHKQVFSADLFRLLVAYFMAHTNSISIDNIDIYDADTTQISRQELSITKRIHDLFVRIVD